jgi:hypothetical protein
MSGSGLRRTVFILFLLDLSAAVSSAEAVVVRSVVDMDAPHDANQTEVRSLKTEVTDEHQELMWSAEAAVGAEDDGQELEMAAEVVVGEEDDGLELEMATEAVVGEEDDGLELEMAAEAVVVSEDDGLELEMAAEAVVGEEDDGLELEMATEAAVGAEDYSQELKRSAEAVVDQSDELLEQVRSRKQEAAQEQTTSENNFMTGRFLDLGKSLRDGFLSSNQILPDNQSQIFSIFLLKLLLVLYQVKTIFSEYFFLMHSPSSRNKVVPLDTFL